MSERHSLEVYDKDGWCRTYPLEKPIIRIGSDSGNDVVLENERGDGVASLHAQLIASSDNGTAYRLINLADTEIRLNPEGGESLLPRSAVNVADAFTFGMGQFTLVFHTGSGAAHTQGKYATSVRQNIGLRLAVERTQLVPEEWINGVVTISNLGDLTGVQFELDLDGFDPDCFDLEPGPLLSSGAEKEVLFRLYHRNVKPSAGQHQVTIRAAAPRAYPGEAASVTQGIEVLPFYRHQISILAPDQTDTPPQEQELLAVKPLVVSTSRPGQPGTAPTDVWSTSGTPASGTRQAMAIKAKSSRPVSIDASDDSAAEAEEWWTTPVASSAPPQAIPTTQEPLAAVPFVDDAQSQTASPEAAELWGVSDESSATKPAAQQPLPPATPQNKSGDEADWWGTPDETDTSTAAVLATAAAVGAIVAATKDNDDDTDPRPRRNQNENETVVADSLLPEPDLPPAPPALPPVNVAQPALNAETTQPTVEDVAQEWLVKSDAESAKARQLADEVDLAIQQQAEKNVDTPPESVTKAAAPVATAAVMSKVARRQPPATATETLPPLPAETSAEALPAQAPVSLWNKFKQKLPFPLESDEAIAEEKIAPEPQESPTPVAMEEPLVEEPLPPQVPVESEPEVVTDAEPMPSTSPEVEPELPQIETAPPEIEETTLPMEEPTVVTEAAPAPPVFQEVEPELPQVEASPPMQIEESQLPVEEPVQIQTEPETDSLPEIEDTTAVETATKLDVAKVGDKTETKEAAAVEDWWGEDFEIDEKPRRVLKLKAESTETLATQSPKEETAPEDWWSEDS